MGRLRVQWGCGTSRGVGGRGGEGMARVYCTGVAKRERERGKEAFQERCRHVNVSN